ncbi:hypothetical protein HPB50_011907 [Hyalomma asiaticum]|uniref:Uncharacterized protein n=1 Tax=Hyalomma asiaticum TaxID=266040 RepID=A0ACB7TJ41_HYAAI|nr:hypothetical protein HPB50_011907 [Hyalomma asiaticum]
MDQKVIASFTLAAMLSSVSSSTANNSANLKVPLVKAIYSSSRIWRGVNPKQHFTACRKQVSRGAVALSETKQQQLTLVLQQVVPQQ